MLNCCLNICFVPLLASVLHGQLATTPAHVADHPAPLVVSSISAAEIRQSLDAIHKQAKQVTGNQKPDLESVDTFLRPVLGFIQLHGQAFQACVRLHLLQQSQYLACTASSATKLNLEVKRQLELIPDNVLERAAKENKLAQAQLDAEELAGSFSDSSDSDGGSADGGSTDEESTDDEIAKGGDKLRKVILGQMMGYRHVVLDEAGAMLEPDMVGTIIHGCRFLLCVGDHRQARPSPCSCMPAAASAAMFEA